MASLKDRWDSYRSEDLHECDLFGLRINALLTSQGVLVAAVAFLVDREGRNLLLPIAVAALGLATCSLSLVALRQGCRAMDMWHAFGRDLLREDAGKELGGMFIDRELPDRLHRWSIDYFAFALGGSFILFWVVAISWLMTKYFSNA